MTSEGKVVRSKAFVATEWDENEASTEESRDKTGDRASVEDII